jgi:DNA end-binding protein Ku
VPKKKPAREEKVVDLLQALRESARLGGTAGTAKRKPAGSTTRRRKAG